LADIKKDEGKIIDYNDEKVGAYKDLEGNIYLVTPYCSHLGCELSWNDLDKTWDCPCHGSKFNYDGKNLYDPAIKDLEVNIIKKETTMY
jgi:Rieske Fe-S protein